MAILLKNATFIHWETLAFDKKNILIEEGSGKPLRFLSDQELALLPSAGLKTIDCEGMYVTKSFGVGHHHVYSGLARGMPAPAKTPVNFREILQYIWWNLDKVLDKDTIEASALATAMACAKAGSTFAIDHHASPGYIRGSLEVIARAFEKVGVGHLLCYEVTDRDGLHQAQEGLEENLHHIKSHQGLIGLHASFTVSDQTLAGAVRIMEETGAGIHMHLAEDLYDQQHCLENYGMRVVQRLQNFGFTQNSKSILVHGIHLDEKERELLAASKAWIAQNVESNLKNKVGMFNGAGIPNSRILLGTDGMHSDMLQSAKAAFFAGLKTDVVSPAIVYERFRNIHRYLAANNFSGDGENNLVVLNYDTPTPFGSENFLGHFIFGLRSQHVKHVVANGRLIVENGAIQTVDEKAILA
ncbi:MAG TPA: amidohydrolase family protein, partial [Bacteroidales bacterium]|nr:amidohydrolase family protein [Bacteroidales bacterium]